MKKPILIVAVIGIILVAFITNPTREKHVNNGLEIIFDTNNKKEGYGVVGGLISTFEKETLSATLNLDNYYLFSISSVGSNKKEDQLKLGLGIFGQVIPISSHEDYKSFGSEVPSLIPVLRNQTDIETRDTIIQSEETKRALDQLINGSEEELE